MELVLVILTLLVAVELVTIINLNDEINELEGLENARTKALNKAENRVKELQEENVILLGNASEQRKITGKYIDILEGIWQEIKSDKFTFDQIDKIKELINDYQSND